MKRWTFVDRVIPIAVLFFHPKTFRRWYDYYFWKIIFFSFLPYGFVSEKFYFNETNQLFYCLLESMKQYFSIKHRSLWIFFKNSKDNIKSVFLLYANTTNTHISESAVHKHPLSTMNKEKRPSTNTQKRHPPTLTPRIFFLFPTNIQTDSHRHPPKFIFFIFV